MKSLGNNIWEYIYFNLYFTNLAIWYMYVYIQNFSLHEYYIIF